MVGIFLSINERKSIERYYTPAIRIALARERDYSKLPATSGDVSARAHIREGSRELSL